jgi:serine/threonine protein kinase
VTQSDEDAVLELEPDPMMRILELRDRLQGRPFTLKTSSGGEIRQYRFTEDEPILGGFAAVFRVLDAERHFALKVTHRAGSSAERMQQESASSELQRVLRENGGPVPMTYHVGRVAGVPAIVMSWETGDSLRGLLDGLGRNARKEQADLRRLSTWIESIVHAMAELDRRVAELHGDGAAGLFVHGDLKPSNILIRSGRSRREPVLATLLDLGESALGPAPGPTGYSEAYACPEIVRRSFDPTTSVTWRSDQYAIGRMLLEGVERIERARMRGSITRRFGRLSRLQAIARRMTSVAPSDRFDSWSSVLDALQSRTRRRIARWSIAAAIFIAVGVLLTLSMIGRGGPSAIVVRTSGSADLVGKLAESMEIKCTVEPFDPDPPACMLPRPGEEARIELPFEVDAVELHDMFRVQIVIQPRREGPLAGLTGLLDESLSRRKTIVDRSVSPDRARPLRAILKEMLADQSVSYEGVRIEIGFR